MSKNECKIKDSGNRTEFESGAVRDMKVGKGRCDLLPLSVISRLIDIFNTAIPNHKKGKEKVENVDPIMGNISKYNEHKIDIYLYLALVAFCYERYDGDIYKMILQLSKHFEEGAKKYGENNWQKGIPEWSYLDSAVRHYLKWMSYKEFNSDKELDEPHDRAFVWNIVCLLWTIENRGKIDISLESLL